MLDRVLALLKRYPLAAFFVLSYAITWPGWWLETTELPLSWLGAVAGYFGPAIVEAVARSSRTHESVLVS